MIVTPSLNHLDVQPSDEFVVLATDGLWDVMEPSDVMRWARNKFKQGKGAKEVSLLTRQEGRAGAVSWALVSRARGVQLLLPARAFSANGTGHAETTRMCAGYGWLCTSTLRMVTLCLGSKAATC